MEREPLAELIGQNIQRLRKKSGMTQAQLAEKIGVSTAFISRVESGNKYVSIKVLAALADEFHVSYDALLRRPQERSGMMGIYMLLEGRSEAYITWAEQILRACGEGPAG